VKLYRDHSQRVENGFYIGQLMNAIRKTMIIQASRKMVYRKPITLDPVLANLKDQVTKPAKDYNWNVIVPELRKFGIRVTKDQKMSIINDSNHEALHEILLKLRDVDLNV